MVLCHSSICDIINHLCIISKYLDGNRVIHLPNQKPSAMKLDMFIIKIVEAKLHSHSPCKIATNPLALPGRLSRKRLDKPKSPTPYFYGIEINNPTSLEQYVLSFFYFPKKKS